MTYAHAAHRTFEKMLSVLGNLALKAENGGLPDEVLNLRLTEDMFPLELQFRVALNQVLLALQQVAGKDVSLEECAYRSFSEIRERINMVETVLQDSPPRGWRAADSIVDLTLPNGVRFVMTSEQDIEDWILPNFYFHVTMSYALLRRAGLELGKMDFLPHMDRHRVEIA